MSFLKYYLVSLVDKLALGARWSLDQFQRCTSTAAHGGAIYVNNSFTILNGSFTSCIAAQGVPDVVVANAGISIGVDTAIRGDIDVIAQTFATNNIGVAATFHPFMQAMARRGSGTLVGVGSVGGIRGMPGHGAYCASKAAVALYCESLRGEMRGSGVKVVTICPGYVDTPLTRHNRYPMPFLMRPADFAARAFAAIEAGVSYRVIPWQMGIVAKLLRVLPDALFDRVFAGRPRKRRVTGE